MTRFDPSPWNLGVPLAGAVMACGPVIPLEEEGPTSLGDTDPNATTGNAGTTGAPECQLDSDCPPYTYCNVFGHCQQTSGCAEFGCCYEEVCCFEDPCCYGGPGCSTCYSHVQCPIGEFCEISYCQVPLFPPACSVAFLSEVVLDTLPDTGTILALAFVEADEDAGRELVVGHDTGAWLVPGPDEPIVALPIPDAAQVMSIAAGDLDGDGDEDLALATISTQGQLVVLRNDGGGVFTPVLPSGVSAAYEVRLADLDGDALPDLVASVDAGTGFPVLVAIPNEGELQFGAMTLLDFMTSQIDFEVGDFDGTGLSDIAGFNNNTTTQVWFGAAPINGSADFVLGDAMGVASVRFAVGDFDGTGVVDLARLATWPQFTLIDSWVGASSSLSENAEWAVNGDMVQATADDVDADGRDDLVMATGTTWFRLLFGGDGWFDCVVELPTDLPSWLLATGDFTGDGAADVVLSDQFGIRVHSIAVAPPG